MSRHGEQKRIVKVVCSVHVLLPGIGRDACERLQIALHKGDRKLGVIVGQSGGVPQFTLLTSERSERAARDRAQRLIAKAATSAGIIAEQLDRIEITRVVSRDRDLTGRPRAIEPPVAVWQNIDLGDCGSALRSA